MEKVFSPHDLGEHGKYQKRHKAHPHINLLAKTGSVGMKFQSNHSGKAKSGKPKEFQGLYSDLWSHYTDYLFFVKR